MRRLRDHLLNWFFTGLLTAIVAVAAAFVIGSTRACESYREFCPFQDTTEPEPRDQGSRMATDTSQREAKDPAVSAPPVSKE
jgi:hypothetical protein